MPASPISPIPLVTVDDSPVTCRRCGHEFQSYIYRTAMGEKVLIDQDGDTIFDLVKTCRYCKDVYHWHSNVKQMQEMTTAYLDMFEIYEELMRSLHGPSEINKTPPTEKENKYDG